MRRLIVISLTVIGMIFMCGSVYAELIFNNQIPNGAIVIDGQSDDWEGINPIITDIQGDTTLENTEERDLKALYLAKDENYIYWRIETWSGNFPDAGMIVSFQEVDKEPYIFHYEVKVEVWFEGQDNFFEKLPGTDYFFLFTGGTDYTRIGSIAEGKFPIDLFDNHSFNTIAMHYTNWNDVSGEGVDDAWLTFDDSDGLSPIANAGSDLICYDEVTLNGTQSYDPDPDGYIFSYNWDLKYRDDSTYDTTATGPNPIISNLQSGFYDVTLTVTDDVGLTGTDSMLLAVAKEVVDEICPGNSENHGPRNGNSENHGPRNRNK
jgi:K319L-like, PKD domain